MAAEIRFTGGDDFAGLLKFYHEMIMQSELIGGKGGYKVSWAGTPKSGLSFGGNQMDMAENKDKVDVFVRILKEARDENGKTFFEEDQIIKMVGADNKEITLAGKSAKEVFGNNLDKVNAALSSEYGQKRLNEEYVKEMNATAKLIQSVIDSLQNPAAKVFYNTVLGRGLLFDYKNQFNLTLKGSFVVNYIDGEFNNKKKTVFGTNEKITAPTDNYTIRDHQAFLNSTKECHERRAGCDNRWDRVKKVFEEQKDLMAAIQKELDSAPIPEVPKINFPDQFAFFRKNGKWEISFDLKLPSFSVPSFEELTPKEMLRRTTQGELYDYFLEGTKIQRNTFYYDGEHLFFVPPERGNRIVAPFPHSEGEWYSIKYGLVRKVLDHYWGETLPRYPNLANYDNYTIQMKKDVVGKEDLLISLENEIRDPDILSLLSILHTPMTVDLFKKPDGAEGEGKKPLSFEAQLEEFFSFVDELMANRPGVLTEQDVISLNLPIIAEREESNEAIRIMPLGGMAPPLLPPMAENSVPRVDYQPSFWETLSSYFYFSNSCQEM